MLRATVAIIVGTMVFSIGFGSVAATTVPVGTAPDTTTNEFIPTEQPLGDCYSMQPPPNCGSEARGGWEQTTLFVVLVVAIAFIAWRVWANIRRVRSDS